MSRKNKAKEKPLSKYSFIEFAIKILVYIIVTGSVTIYVLLHWDIVTSFTFFTIFDGKNLMFLFWIVLLLLPLIGTFEGFGVKLDFWVHLKAVEENENKLKEMKLEKLEAEKDAQLEKQTEKISVENQFAEITQAYNESIRGGNDNV